MSTAQSGAPSARSLFQSILRGSGLYSIALVGQRLAGVILLPIVTRFLTPADYGVLDLLEQVGTVLSLLLGGSFSSALGYFYFKRDSTAARRPVVGSTVMGAAAIGALAALICWPFAAPLSHLVFGDTPAEFYLRIVLLSMPPGFLLEALFGWLRVENRPIVYLIGTFVRVAVTIAGTVALVALLRLRVLGVLYTSLIAILLSALFLAVYCFRAARPVFDARLFVRIARFSAPMGLSGIALFIIHFGDRFILPHYRPFTELGIYVLAYKLGMLIGFIYSSFHIYWNAQVFQIVRRDDAETVFARIFTYVILALSFCGLGLIVSARPILRLLAAPAFQGAAALVPVIVIAYYVRAIGDFFRCLFIVEGRPSYNAVCNWVGAVVCLAGYFTLIPRFGMWGAAIATAATFTVIGVISVVWTYRLKPYRLEFGRLAKIVGAIAAAACLHVLVPASSLPAQIGWAGLSLASFPLALWLLSFPTLGERQTARAALQSLARRRPKMT